MNITLIFLIITQVILKFVFRGFRQSKKEYDIRFFIRISLICLIGSLKNKEFIFYVTVGLEGLVIDGGVLIVYMMFTQGFMIEISRRISSIFISVDIIFWFL